MYSVIPKARLRKAQLKQKMGNKVGSAVFKQTLLSDTGIIIIMEVVVVLWGNVEAVTIVTANRSSIYNSKMAPTYTVAFLRQAA